MLLVISKIKVRSGHFEKVFPFVEQNSHLAKSFSGCLDAYIGRGIDNPDEILVYSRWTSLKEYEDAKKEMKKEPRFRKLAFQLLPHLKEEPGLKQYSVVYGL